MSASSRLPRAASAHDELAMIHAEAMTVACSWCHQPKDATCVVVVGRLRGQPCRIPHAVRITDADRLLRGLPSRQLASYRAGQTPAPVTEPATQPRRARS